MEVSDLFVINKADRPGADRMAREISQMLHLRAGKVMRNVPAHHGVDLRRAARGAPHAESAAQAPPAARAWEIPVLQTVAHEGRGISELAHALARHRAWLEQSGEQGRRRQKRMARRVREEVERTLRRRVWEEQGRRLLDQAMNGLERGETTPYEVAAGIVAAVLDGSAPGNRGS